MHVTQLTFGDDVRLRPAIDRCLEVVVRDMWDSLRFRHQVRIDTVRSVHRATSGKRWRQSSAMYTSQSAEAVLDYTSAVGIAIYTHYGNQRVGLNGTKMSPRCLSRLRGGDFIVMVKPTTEIGQALLEGDVAPRTDWTLPHDERTEHVDLVRLDNLRDVVAVLATLRELQ